MALYRFAALEGGGAKGFIYLGVAKALAKLGILDDFEAISGASVGAMGALLLSTGWPVEKMEKLFNDIKFSEMASGGWWEKLTGPLTFFRWFGLHRADRFHNLFKKIVKEVTGNENTTFEQWHQFKEAHPELKLKDIFVEACNLNTKVNETFSYLSEHKDVPIADAVRASMGFPVYFSPWTIKGCLYGDGGEQNNCPSDVFEVKPGEFNPEVLSVRLDSLDEIRYFKYGVKPPATPIKNSLECTFAHFESATNAQNRAFFQSPYKDRTVFCDTLDVPTLKFDLDTETRAALVASGEYGVVRYFYKHHPEVVEKAHDKETLKQIERADFPICFTEFVSKSSRKAKFSTVAQSDLAAPSKTSTPLFHHWCKLPGMQRESKNFKNIDYKAIAKAQKEKDAEQRSRLRTKVSSEPVQKKAPQRRKIGGSKG